MEKKITKKEMYNTMLDKYDFTDDEVAFIEHEIELLSKKRSSSGKPTASQELTLILKPQVEEILADGRFTATKILKELQPMHEDIILTNQRITAVLGKLIEDGVVVRIKEGKHTLFGLA